MSKFSDSSCYEKLTQSNTTFMKKLSWENVVWMVENTLEPTVYAWMVTLGDWMVPFRVFDIIQAFLAFFKAENTLRKFWKRRKDIRKEEKWRTRGEHTLHLQVLFAFLRVLFILFPFLFYIVLTFSSCY